MTDRLEVVPWTRPTPCGIRGTTTLVEDLAGGLPRAAASLPGELPFDLFGDAITSTLSRVLAALSGDPDLMDSLIRDRALNEYVRSEAAETYVCLVRDGRLKRQEAVRRLQQRLREAQEGDRSIFPANTSL